MSEYIVKLPISGAADEFFKIHEMPDMTLYGYPLTGKIVRCRDCKHFMNGDLCKLQDEWNEFHWLQVEPDGFCKWGERRGA